MYSAQIKFEIFGKFATDEQSNIVQSVLSNLCFDGRILGNEFQVFEKQNSLFSVVLIPEKDALKKLRKLEWFKADLKSLDKIGLSQPDFEILGKVTEVSESCFCENSSAYILFTNFLSIQSPIKCYDCGLPIPLYRIEQQNSQQLRTTLGWQNEYKACDLLQMHCGFGERFGARQMSDLNSGLSQTGLKICSEINSLTKKNCYYYLYRWSGKSLNKEKDRKCPNCGGNWLLKEELHDLFDFRCDKCHLLSNIAFNLK